MIKPRAINTIAYKPSDKRNRSRMERGLYDGYNSLPGELLTFEHAYYRRLPRIRSDKRQLYGAQNVYHSGISRPNYPMPALTLPATYHPLTGWSAWQIATDKDQD